jgi:hypothetical protein
MIRVPSADINRGSPLAIPAMIARLKSSQMAESFQENFRRFG